MIEDEVMSFKEAAAFLKLNKNTLVKLAREGKIPAQKAGKQWRFSKSALMKWLEGSQLKTEKN